MMIERRLGRSGLQVSRLGLACMGFSLDRGQTAMLSTRRESIAAIRTAHELGITFLDTAAAYGPHANEDLVGEAIAPFKRDVVVATKFGYAIEDGRIVALDSRPEAIRRSAEASLRRLGVECIDVLYQQRADPSVPIDDVAGTVQDLIAQGKVRHFGLCDADEATVRRAHAVQAVSVVQADYSLWARDAEGGLLQALDELGIGLVPWNPLGQGYAVSLDPTCGASLRANRSLLSRIRRVADDHAATVMQVATAWVMAQRPWIVPMIDGADWRKLGDGLSSAHLALTDRELDELGGAGAPDGASAAYSAQPERRVPWRRRSAVGVDRSLEPPSRIAV